MPRPTPAPSCMAAAAATAPGRFGRCSAFRAAAAARLLQLLLLELLLQAGRKAIQCRLHLLPVPHHRDEVRVAAEEERGGRGAEAQSGAPLVHGARRPLPMHDMHAACPAGHSSTHSAAQRPAAASADHGHAPPPPWLCGSPRGQFAPGVGVLPVVQQHVDACSAAKRREVAHGPLHARAGRQLGLGGRAARMRRQGCSGEVRAPRAVLLMTVQGLLDSARGRIGHPPSRRAPRGLMM